MPVSEELRRRACIGLVVLAVVFVVLVAIGVYLVWQLFEYGCKGISIPGLIALTLLSLALLVVIVITRQWIYKSDSPQEIFQAYF